MIQIDALRKSYDGVNWAIDDISLRVKKEILLSFWGLSDLGNRLF
jgi:ABC-type Fe3+/spermidine/putrescine transport system ATPase subunit